LIASEAIVGQEARGHHRDHAIDDEGAMPERPFGQVELHQRDPSRRVFWPGCRAWGPAGTTISPVASPSGMATVAGSWRSTATLRSDTVRLAGSTTQTAGRRSDSVSADAGISMTGTASSCMRPTTVEPSRIAAGGSVRPTLTSNVLVTGSAC